jgi:hypothetical protein
MRPHENIAVGAFQLRRAADSIQQHASDPRTVDALPIAFEDIEVALERLASAAVMVAEAVEDRTALEGDGLTPEARALRWHLFHLAALLQTAGDALPETRSWARKLLAEHEDVGANANAAAV